MRVNITSVRQDRGNDASGKAMEIAQNILKQTCQQSKSQRQKD
jgi:hypothetical protein